MYHNRLSLVFYPFLLRIVCIVIIFFLIRLDQIHLRVCVSVCLFSEIDNIHIIEERSFLAGLTNDWLEERSFSQPLS